MGPYSFATPSSEEGQLGETTSCQQRVSFLTAPWAAQRGSFPPAPDREAGPLTLGTRGKPSGLRPISVSLCCLLSSHRPGHHTIAHAAGGHWSQPDLQGEPGSWWPCQLHLVPRDGALWAQGPLETLTLLPVARTDAALYACRILTEAGAQLSPCGPASALWVIGKGIWALGGWKGWSGANRAEVEFEEAKNTAWVWVHVGLDCVSGGQPGG